MLRQYYLIFFIIYRFNSVFSVLLSFCLNIIRKMTGKLTRKGKNCILYTSSVPPDVVLYKNNHVKGRNQYAGKICYYDHKTIWQLRTSYCQRNGKVTGYRLL